MNSFVKIALLGSAAGALAYTAAKKIMPDISKETIKKKAQEIADKASIPKKEEVSQIISNIGDTAVKLGKGIEEGAKDFAKKNINPDGPLATSFKELKDTLASKLNEMEPVSNFPENWIKFLDIYEKNLSEGTDENIAKIGDIKLNHDEFLSQFTLWAFMGAPLNISDDIKSLGDEEKITDLLNIASNEDIIKIKEDSLNKSPVRIKTDEFEDIILKPLAQNEFAICFFNKSNDMRIMELNIPDCTKNDFILTSQSDCYEVYDLLTKESFDIKDDLLKYVLPHGTRSFRVKAKN